MPAPAVWLLAGCGSMSVMSTTEFSTERKLLICFLTSMVQMFRINICLNHVTFLGVRLHGHILPSGYNA